MDRPLHGVTRRRPLTQASGRIATHTKVKWALEVHVDSSKTSPKPRMNSPIGAFSVAGKTAAQIRSRLVSHWPLVAGGLFFIFYQYWMFFLLYSGRELPPINDSFYYVFRIATVFRGKLVNDTSILYTYTAALLGWVGSLTPLQTFRLVGFIGPAFTALVLYRLFTKLRFSPAVAGTCFFLLAFYCNIGPHSFLHFVPSTFSVLLCLLWLSFAVDENTRYPFAAGFFVSAALFLAHSGGVISVIVNSFWLVVASWRERDTRWRRLLAGGILATIVCAAMLKILPFIPSHATLETSEWIKSSELAEHKSFGGGRYSPGAANSFASVELAKAEAELAGRELWFARLYGNFFIYLFPKWYFALVVVPLLLLLMRNSYTKKTSAIHAPKLLLFTCAYFLLFVVLSYWHQRGSRFVEYAFPLLFICFGILLADIGRRWLRRVALALVALYLAFLSYNFTTTENLLYKRLAALPEPLRSEMEKFPAFYIGSQVAGYLLANGLFRVEAIYLLPFFKEQSDRYHLTTFTPCPSAEPQNFVRKIFRKMSPAREASTPDNVLQVNYAKTMQAQYVPVLEDEAACLKVYKIRFPKAR